VKDLGKMMSGLRIALNYLIIFCFAGCAALKSATNTAPLPEPLPWTGKYVRVDGAYDLYSEFDPKTQLIDVSIVGHGKDPKVFKNILGGFVGSVKGDVAIEMQICRSGACKEFLGDLQRTTDSMIFLDYGDHKDFGPGAHDGPYRTAGH
jgi:hypothetical protein